MKIHERIDNARIPMSEALSFADDTLINDCIDLVKGKYVVDLLNKEALTEEDMDLIRSVSGCQSSIEQADDITNLIVQMVSKARERSHGSAPLAKVFIRSDEYDKLIDHLDVEKETKIKILGIPVERAKKIIHSKLIAFGLCKPKFKNIPINMLIILGKFTEQ